MTMTVKASTLGRRIRAAEFQDFNIAEVLYSPNSNLGLHDHDFTYLSPVLYRSFEEHVGRKVEMARSASVVVMPRGVMHNECMGHLGARSLTVALRSSFFREVPRSEQQLGEWRWFHGGPVARLMFRAYKECLLADGVTELGLNEQLLELLGTIVSGRE